MERDITLTDREKSVVECIKRGLITSEEISKELNLAKCYTDKLLCDLFIKFDTVGKQPRARLVWRLLNEQIHC